MTDISDGIQFRRDGVNPNQWPKLSCSQANQLALEVSNLRLDANREIFFQENGQISASGDMLFLTGGFSPEKLRILANGNVGIGKSDPVAKLEVNGDLKLQQGVAVNEFSSDRTLANNSDLALPTQKAVKTYVDAQITQVNQTLSTKAALVGASSQDFQTKNLTVSGNLSTTGNVGIGTTNPTYKLEVVGDIKAISIHSKLKVFSFKVDGDFDKFYPIVFSDDNWNDGPTELEIDRPSVHTDSEWRGALNSRFTFHSSSWGHGADFCKAEIYYSQIQFVAGYQNYYYNPRFIVWLRGGGTTYSWRSRTSITLADYSATEKVVELSKEYTLKYPESAVTYSVKNNIDSSVQA